jgi:hypothetical protein
VLSLRAARFRRSVPAMRLSRLLSAAFVVGVASATTILACGGGGGGDDNSKMDAPKVFMDGKVYMDAPAATGGLGQACTPDGSGGQGNCPAGFNCLNLMGGTGAWCSKTCTQGSGDTCKMGYTGPGVANCYLQVMGSNSSQFYCGVICAETTPNTICGPMGSASCTHTCPAPLMCKAPLTSGSNNLGSGCE